jgi:hypothetical protein
MIWRLSSLPGCADPKYAVDVVYKILYATRSYACQSDAHLRHPSSAETAGLIRMASTVPSLRTLSRYALGGAQLLLGCGSRTVLGGTPKTCSGTLQLSCHNTTAVQDLCCFNAPGGQLLQTQFWDTNPATGPDDSWTIHGLW